MTYIADLDPNSPVVLAHEQAVAYWDDVLPGWEENSVDPEAARFVPAQDVENAELFIVTRYGWDHARLIPGLED